MARKKENNSANDFTGGRDSLGPVHPPSEEEEREAGLRLAEAALRWRRRNRHAYRRMQFPLEEVLLMLDIKKEPSDIFRTREAMRGPSMRAKGWFGRRDESGQ